MSEHTPGPWECDGETVWDANLPHTVDPERQTGNWEIFIDGGDTIIGNINGQIPEGVANARLVAAAPEMFEALKTVVRALESDEWKAWEGMAVLSEQRSKGHLMIEAVEKGTDMPRLGYQGEQFMDAVRGAIAKAEGRDS